MDMIRRLIYTSNKAGGKFREKNQGDGRTKALDFVSKNPKNHKHFFHPIETVKSEIASAVIVSCFVFCLANDIG